MSRLYCSQPKSLDFECRRCPTLSSGTTLPLSVHFTRYKLLLPLYIIFRRRSSKHAARLFHEALGCINWLDRPVIADSAAAAGNERHAPYRFVLVREEGRIDNIAILAGASLMPASRARVASRYQCIRGWF